MMNEWIFLVHSCLVAAFALGALRLGKEVLVSWIALQAILANLFVIKQMDLLSLTVTCSDVFAIGGILGQNLLQEYYGKEAAKKVLIAAFLSLLFFTLMSQLHLAYIASVYDQTQGAFKTILEPCPRIMLASFATFYLVQRWDIWFFDKLKRHSTSLPLWMRTGFSLIVSQLFDTTLFSLLGLYGTVASCLHIIAFSYAIKLLVIAIMTPFTNLSKRLIRPVALETST